MLYQTLTSLTVLAQADDAGPRGYTISIAIMLLSVVLGLFVALRPAKREEKVKLPKKQD